MIPNLSECFDLLRTSGTYQCCLILDFNEKRSPADVPQKAALADE
jgi:hypothetical protein